MQFQGISHVMAEAARRPPAEPGLLRRADGSRPRVLLAEDSDTARILTAALLRWMGCEVDAVEDGEQALSHAQNFLYDLILLDIEMPIMDGVITARSIRALGGAAGATPLMALSAFLADTSTCDHWQETFDVALAKPAGRDELRLVIERMLNSRTRRNPMRPRDQSRQNADLLIDEEQLAQLKAELTGSAWRQLLATAISEIREIVDTIGFAQAVGNSGSVARSAHRLKGIARSFATPRMAAMAEHLEAQAADGPADDLDSVVAQLVQTADQTLLAIAMLPEHRVAAPAA